MYENHSCMTLPTPWLSLGEQSALSSRMPRPHLLTRKNGLVTIEWFLGCAKSAVVIQNNPIKSMQPCAWPFAAALTEDETICSIYIPRLQESFSSPEIAKAIEDSVKTLGYEQARRVQLDVIIKVTMCSLLTHRWGKRLCFANLPLVHDYPRGVFEKSIAIIVSPLNELMQDQVA